MKNEQRFRWIIRAVNHYFTFFLLVAFVITCCMMLFLSILSENLGIELNSDNIASAAKVTFWNVILISLLFTVIDGVRRRLTVDRHVRHISAAAEKMIQGDFTVRVPETETFKIQELHLPVYHYLCAMLEEIFFG